MEQVKFLEDNLKNLKWTSHFLKAVFHKFHLSILEYFIPYNDGKN